MNSLNEVLAQIAIEEPLSKMELETKPHQARAGLSARKSQAVQSLESLGQSFMTLAASGAKAIFVQGDAPHQEALRGKASRSGFPVLDAKAFYLKICEQAAQSMGGSGRFGPAEAGHVLQAMRAVCVELLKIDEFLRPDFSPLYGKHLDAASLVLEVQHSVVAKNGHRLAALYVLKSAATKALEAKLAADYMPVVILHASPDEISGFKASGVFRKSEAAHVDCDQDVEQVIATLKTAVVVSNPSAVPQQSAESPAAAAVKKAAVRKK